MDVPVSGSKISLSLYRILEDDLQISPRYEPSPVIQLEALKKYPKLQTLLESLSGKISESTMRALNAEVEINHQTPASVAQHWLSRQSSAP